ncbi:BTB/POZ protein [Whalleya microplaca]|nr:BTB/POZ protein [Whalleya microplaca]
MYIALLLGLSRVATTTPLSISPLHSLEYKNAHQPIMPSLVQATTTMASSSLRDAGESDLSLLKSGLFSDVLVKCDGREWNLHKAILCSRSQWFRAALTNGFQESMTGVITLEEQDAEVVDWLIYYIYKEEFPRVITGNHNTIFTHLTCLYKAADFFQLDRAQRLCIDMLKVELHGTNFITILSDREGSRGLMPFDLISEEKVEDMYQAITLSMHVPKGEKLRDVYVRWLRSENSVPARDPKVLHRLGSIPGFQVTS